MKYFFTLFLLIGMLSCSSDSDNEVDPNQDDIIERYLRIQRYNGNGTQEINPIEHYYELNYTDSTAIYIIKYSTSTPTEEYHGTFTIPESSSQTYVYFTWDKNQYYENCVLTEAGHYFDENMSEDLDYLKKHSIDTGDPSYKCE